MKKVTKLLGILSFLTVLVSCAGGSIEEQPAENDVLINLCRYGWVESITPAGGSADVAPGSSILIKARDEIEIVAKDESEGSCLEEIDVIVEGPDSKIDGIISENSLTKTITFTPAHELPTSSVIVVRASFSRCSGENSAQFTSSFTTGKAPDSTPPELLSMSPENGSTNVALNASIVIIFSEDVMESTVNSENIVFLDPNGSPIETSVSYNSAIRTASLTSKMDLLPDTSYSVLIRNISDLSGNMISERIMTFTTGMEADVTAPSAVSVSLKPHTRATITWAAPDDDGKAASWYGLRYSKMPIEDDSNFSQATPVLSLPKPADAGTIQEFVIPRMEIGNFHFAFRAYDDAGNASGISSSLISISGRVTKVSKSTEKLMASDLGAKSIAGGCDINDDGLDDMIVGSPYDDEVAKDVGQVHVYFGKSDVPMGQDVAGDSTNTPDLTIDGIDSHATNANDFFGYSTACGDFNGDGYDDIVIGAPYEDTRDGEIYASNSGAAYLFFGRASMVDDGVLSAADANVVFQGRNASDYFGWSVAMLGDLDDDGRNDLGIVAAYGEVVNTNEGVAYIFFGEDAESGSTVYDVNADVMIRGEASASLLHKIAPAGDVDGDGTLDLALSTGTWPSNKKGSIYIILGKEGYADLISLANDADIILSGSSDNDYLGGPNNYDRAFAIDGDINGDGIDDIVVSAPYFDADNLTNVGKVYIFHGRGEIDDVAGLEDADITITGKIANDYFGFIVDTNGDFNNDGIDDLLVTAPYFDNGISGDHGGAFIFFGNSAWENDLSWQDADVVIGTSDGLLQDIGSDDVSKKDYLGYSGAFLGDTNGDGYDDVAIGSPYVDIGNVTNAGGVLIVQ